MKRPPTEKQERLAEMIHKATGVNLPDEKTRQSLFIYIRDNKPEFDKKAKDNGKRGGWNWLDTIDRETDAKMAECFDVW